MYDLLQTGKWGLKPRCEGNEISTYMVKESSWKVYETFSQKLSCYSCEADEAAGYPGF